MNVYQSRRAKIAKTMAPDSLLILTGNGELERTNDSNYPFRQSNNFLYLSGISQPDALLVIRKAQDESITEQLYISQLHPFMAVWEGRSNQIDELRATSCINDIQEFKEREELIAKLLQDKPQIAYLDMPDSTNAQIAAWQLWNMVKEIDPDLDLGAINPEIINLRVIKDKKEIELLEEAIHQTDLALQHVRPLLVPGVTELAIASEFVRFASVQGYEQAFAPIVSFGKSACVIHHTPDATKLVEGDLVLFDVGLEVEGYAADISRMVQIGEGSKRQNEVLEAVKSVQADAIKLMKPGIKFNEFEHQVADIMVDKLVELGLFKSADEAMALDGELQWPAYRRYFNHYTSHFLGLDAHDVGSREATFEPGMVLTCEPGIYIAEEGIGVRIEDDVLITEQGNRVLSAEPGPQ